MGSLVPGLHAWLGPGCHFSGHPGRCWDTAEQELPTRRVCGCWTEQRGSGAGLGGTHSTGCWAPAAACPVGPGRSTGEGTVCQGQWTQLTLVSPLHLTLCNHGAGQRDREGEQRGAARQPFALSLLPPTPKNGCGTELWTGTLNTEEKGKSRLRLGWQGRWAMSRLRVSLESLGQEAHLEVTHLILVTHGIQLLQLLGPVARLLLRDVYKQNFRVPGSGDPWIPSLGPWFRDVGRSRGTPGTDGGGGAGSRELWEGLPSSVPKWVL